ncbi:hypothetical protein [Wukongibacter sp. M2B1]|uniref:hypothetical protein n=1 Tax=Wukongibacter sp. M2B1 TaxID=3088895 RepID=UPI003D7BCE92
MAAFFYPDFMLKKKNNHMENKKANRDSEKSFEECLISINNRFEQENMKNNKENSK